LTTPLAGIFFHLVLVPFLHSFHPCFGMFPLFYLSQRPLPSKEEFEKIKARRLAFSPFSVFVRCW